MKVVMQHLTTAFIIDLIERMFIVLYRRGDFRIW